MAETKTRKVTLIPGDGIGPEVTQAVVRILEATGVKWEWERFAAGALHLPRQENPHAEEGDQRQAVEQQRHHPAIAVAERLGADLHVLALQALHQRRIVRRIGLEGAIVGEMAGDLVTGDRHVMHAALVDLGQQFAEGDVANWRALSRLLEEHDERHDQQADDCP